VPRRRFREAGESFFGREEESNSETGFVSFMLGGLGGEEVGNGTKASSREKKGANIWGGEGGGYKPTFPVEATLSVTPKKTETKRKEGWTTNKGRKDIAISRDAWCPLR